MLKRFAAPDNCSGQPPLTIAHCLLPVCGVFQACWSPLTGPHGIVYRKPVSKSFRVQAATIMRGDGRSVANRLQAGVTRLFTRIQRCPIVRTYAGGTAPGTQTEKSEL